ncbi:esterase [Maribacter sp. MJ134]|uniref:alpha/beta hydrolase n=1 Tax=Maribacter sp. MJ134 TaxID=2496865 RepID=UPI000F8472E8|nr:esterase [Maribacter sp. MJ134]AZQ58449.1 esterase [Maribacter sp. MJ134]
MTRKTITYTTTNSYETLNKIGPKTKNVWIVFHGLGYLSRYFLNHFKELEADENYIIAPQAPSKYYLKNEFKHVGASWLTKEDTKQETQNVMTYINAIMKEETLPKNCKLIIFGFSQGVSIAARWVANYQIPCNKLVFYAGGIPNELTPSDFLFLSDTETEIIGIIGDSDEYLTEERVKSETEKMNSLFRRKAKQITFNGGHEIKKEIINSLVW